MSPRQHTQGGGVTGQPTFQTDSVEIKHYFSFRLIFATFYDLKVERHLIGEMK